MRHLLKRTLTSLAVATAVAAAPSAFATNGYFKIGFGAKNMGMGGAGIAFAQDTLGAATNPASLSGVGNRIDAGFEIFNPQREGSVDASGMDGDGPGPAAPGANSNQNSGATIFAIPNFGVSTELAGGMTVGLTLVSNGGMNTRYGHSDGTGNVFTDAFTPAIPGFVGALIASFPGDAATIGGNAAALGAAPHLTPSLGVNLAQVLIMPTLAYKFTDHQSVGISPVIAYQRFRAYGLGLFSAFSSDPSKLTNRGDDQAWGGGVQIGYQGDFGHFISVGLSGRSKLYMQDFDKYAGLFAEGGGFDIPATFGGGIAIHATPKLTIAGDVTRILYSGVDSIHNDGPTADQFFGGLAAALTNGVAGSPFTVSNPLGTNNGWGFGWDDVTVYKIGVNYEYSNRWAFRAGFNYAESPYDDDQTLFNVLAPGLVEKHATVGFTFSPSSNSELTVTYMHAFRNDQSFTYTASAASGFPGQSFKVRNAMQQNAIDVSWGWRF